MMARRTDDADDLDSVVDEDYDDQPRVDHRATLDPQAVDLAMDRPWDQRSDQDWEAILVAVRGAVRYILGTRYNHGGLAGVMRNAEDDIVQAVMLRLYRPSRFSLAKCPAHNSPRCWGHLVQLAAGATIDTYRAATAGCRDTRICGELEPSMDWAADGMDADLATERIMDRLAAGEVDAKSRARAVEALAELGVVVGDVGIVRVASAGEGA